MNDQYMIHIPIENVRRVILYCKYGAFFVRLSSVVRRVFYSSTVVVPRTAVVVVVVLVTVLRSSTVTSTIYE